ncbi:MAG TPA: methyltransferase domain-containing protein, partial [Chitinophaga sp.]
MGNPYFKFKQFIVRQDRCAMKVCTDACLQGAYTARYLSGKPSVGRVLDIGTGTGLLSLMGAQQSNAFFTGVELDVAAGAQAAENFAASPWKARLAAVCTDARTFSAPAPFDFIISNP